MKPSPLHSARASRRRARARGETVLTSESEHDDAHPKQTRKRTRALRNVRIHRGLPGRRAPRQRASVLELLGNGDNYLACRDESDRTLPEVRENCNAVHVLRRMPEASSGKGKKAVQGRKSGTGNQRGRGPATCRAEQRKPCRPAGANKVARDNLASSATRSDNRSGR